MEKKTEAVTVKLSESSFRFVSVRSKQLGMESAGEYIRHLISADEAHASSDFNLLAEALGHNVSIGNTENKAGSAT